MNLLADTLLRLQDLCDQTQRQFNLKPGGAELLVLELLVAHLMSEEKNRLQVRNYILLMVNQITEQTFDEEIMDLARARVLEALKDD